MWNYVGIVRTYERLKRAVADMQQLGNRLTKFYHEADDQQVDRRAVPRPADGGDRRRRGDPQSALDRGSFPERLTRFDGQHGLWFIQISVVGNHVTECIVSPLLVVLVLRCSRLAVRRTDRYVDLAGSSVPLRRRHASS